MENSNDLFGQILSHGPSQSTLLLVLTKMKNEGRSSEVIQECIRVLNFYPDDIRIRRLLAESYLQEGLVAQAEAELDRVTSDIVGLVSSFKLQAQVYIQQNREGEAVEALKRYLVYSPDDQEALDLLNRARPVEEEPVKEVPEAPGDIVPKPLPEAPEITEDITGAAEEGEVFAELATPTLAEIYYNQGQLHEAISTYEKYLSDNPDNKASLERLAELKVLIAEDTGTQVTDEAKLRTKTERMVSIMEGWLERVQELSRA